MTKEIWQLIKQYIDERIIEQTGDHDIEFMGSSYSLDSKIEELVDRESDEISQMWHKINGMEND